MLARVCETQLGMMPAAELTVWQRFAAWRQARHAAKALCVISRRQNDHLLEDIRLDRRDFPSERNLDHALWY